MATQPPEPSHKPTGDSEKLEAVYFPPPLRKQIARHIATLKFGRITLCIDQGRILYVEKTVSEQAATS